MNQTSYVNAVAKRLACSKARQAEFVRDLESDIAAALAAGETWEQVEARMGDPRQVTREFNEDLSEIERVAGKKRKRNKIIVIVVAVVIAMAAILGGAVLWVTPHQGPVTQLESSDEMAVFAQGVVTDFDAGEYDGIRALASKEAASLLTDEVFAHARASITQGDWGAFVSFGSTYRAEVAQMGQSVEVVQQVVVYENAAVMFTFMLDDDAKLSGFYVM